jgi:hypothetical protein
MSISPRSFPLPPQLFGPIVGVDPDGLPPIRGDLAAEFLIENDRALEIGVS